MQSFIAFIVVIGILIFVHELGHYLAARLVGVKVLKFSLGFGPKLIGKQIGETEYKISVVPLGGYVKLLGEESEESPSDTSDSSSPLQKDNSRSFTIQPLWKRFTIVGAGPVFNLLLAYLIFAVMLATGFSMYVPQFESIFPVIEKVQEDSPAMEAGFKPGDKVLSIDDREISTWVEMTEIVRKNPGKRLNIEVERDGRIVRLFVVPELKEVETSPGEKEKVGMIGVAKGMKGTLIEVDHPLTAVYKGLEATWGWTKFTVVGIGKLITGQISVKNIGGPILIGQMSGRAASEGAASLFWLVAIISINLGVINLFPIPVLDGGHLVFFLIEGMMGRPMNVRHREIAQQIGLYLLILLMGLAIYNDVARLFTG